MVARLDVGDVLPHLLHDPCGLVTENDRELGRIQPLDEVQVAVTDARRGGTNQYLAWSRFRNRDLLDLQGLAHLTEYGCFH